MSRIGKKPIDIPQNIEVKIEGQDVLIKGPKGEFKREIPEEISVVKEDNVLKVSLKRKTKKGPALWGLTRTLLFNCIKGVTEGFEKKLELRGIGYKSSLLNDKLLKLEVGFSHPVEINVPEDLAVSVGKNIITISGIDKQKVGQFAAEIRRVRPPEPYKGKGIRYFGEHVRIKEGKKATTAG
jgi:large subunit ribosomal protein L6